MRLFLQDGNKSALSLYNSWFEKQFANFHFVFFESAIVNIESIVINCNSGRFSWP